MNDIGFSGNFFDVGLLESFEILLKKLMSKILLVVVS